MIPGVSDGLAQARRQETELRIAAVYGCPISALVLRRFEAAAREVTKAALDAIFTGSSILRVEPGVGVERVAPMTFYKWPDKED